MFFDAPEFFATVFCYPFFASSLFCCYTFECIMYGYIFFMIVILGKKTFACNGTVVDHPEYGEVIQFQGDQRNNICEFLTTNAIAKPSQLKVHGF